VTHPTAVRQHDTHEELVGPDAPSAPPSATLAPDAIIVPASRQAAHLDHAVTLARATSCQLVLLCSREADTTGVTQFLAQRSFGGATVVELPDGYGHGLFKFETSALVASGLPDACPARDTDLSIKRNIGLALARLVGWQRVFFLDDDIRDLDATALRRTVTMLGQYSAVGMRVSEFPDNSVVCHAHRATGGRQGVNVSGSALAVDCAMPTGFFPDIYNEDWLFFYDHAKAGRLRTSGINVTQLRYDPFADPERAARQEFGDVLAEGLYALLHKPAGAVDADRGYWSHFLAARKRFLDAIIDRLEFVKPPLEPQKIFDAVDEARRILADIQPDLCAEYIKLWRADLESWEERLASLPSLLPITHALDLLGLAAAEGSGHAGPPYGDADVAAGMPQDPMITASPAILGSGVAENGPWTALGPVAEGTDSALSLAGSVTATRTRALASVDVIAASMRWATLATAFGMLWILTAANVGLRAGPARPAAGGRRWRAAVDPRRWRRGSTPTAERHPVAGSCPLLGSPL
jgi:hypothetical protein